MIHNTNISKVDQGPTNVAGFNASYLYGPGPYPRFNATAKSYNKDTKKVSVTCDIYDNYSGRNYTFLLETFLA